MEALHKKVENQVQFWSLLGPFIILLSIAVLLFKVSGHWYFPLSALIGIPLCVKWKMKGMAAALSCLFLLSVLAYQTLDLDERYWHVGMALAMAFSFIILTLSLEEVQSLVEKQRLESQSRLDNFLRIDEQWKAAEEVWIAEREKLAGQVQAITQDAAKAQEEKQTFYKLAQLAREEILQVREQQHQLLQDLFYKKQQIAQMQERIDETDLTVQEFVNTDAQKKIKQLNEDLSALQEETAALKGRVEILQVERQVSKQDAERAQNELNEGLEREKLLWDNQKKCQQEKQGLQNALKSLQTEHEQLISENKKLQEGCKSSQAQAEKQIIDQKVHFERDIASLIARAERAETELAQLNVKQKAAIHTALESQEVIEQLNHELKTEKKIAQETAQQLQGLSHLNKQLELALQEVRSELEKNRKLLESAARYQENLPYVDGNTRRIETMYVQLKEQFQEKSAILDATRRELFRVEEKLLQKQREEEETQWDDLSETERHYQTDLCLVTHQFDQMKKLYQQEVDDLSSLVSALFKEMTKS